MCPCVLNCGLQQQDRLRVRLAGRHDQAQLAPIYTQKNLSIEVCKASYVIAPKG